MTRKQNKKLRHKTGHQCDAGSCVVVCRLDKQEMCAKAECEALAEGTVYECPDRELNYWDRLNAA